MKYFVRKLSVLASPLVALVAVARADIHFVDATAGSGLETFLHTPNSLSAPGLNEWILSGVAVADLNGDEWPDIIATKGGVGQDRLYSNNGNGTFTNTAGPLGVAAVHAANGVSCADYDRDGDIDIYMTSYGSSTGNVGEPGRNRLYRNDTTVFTEIAGAVGVAFTSPTTSVGDGAAWGDYDLDGDLDLATAGWSSSGLGNRLFRNDNGMFTDVTNLALVIPSSWGFQPTFVDLTGDGFPELLIAGDFGTSQAFINKRDGTFELATNALGLGIDQYGMGACVADFNRDGTADYYVTSIHMESPKSGTHNGNALYRNGGDGICVESALERGCSDGGWGWGVMAADFDHDGREDIVEVNGRNAGEWANEQEYVYRNLGDGRFVRLGADAGITLAGDARCVVTFDYDRDGDLDVLMFVNAGPMKHFRNESTVGGRGLTHWLKLTLEVAPEAGAVSRCAPHGFGAVVECTVDGVVQWRFPHSGSGFHSSSEPVVHFGFSSGTVATSLRVYWPSGQTTEWTNVALDCHLKIKAPGIADLDASGTVDATDLSQLIAEWGADDLERREMRRADLDRNASVGAGDLSILLAAWGS